MNRQRGILQLTACIALLTACGSEYEPYTVAPESTTPPLEALLVHAGPNSTGTGTIAGSGIDCSIAGATIANTCVAKLDRGKVVTLTAEATGSSTFLGWGDACATAGSSRTCTVTVSQALAVSASFQAPAPPPPTYLVTVRTAIGNTGSGAVSGPGINCVISGTLQSGDCNEELSDGAQLTLTATGTGGDVFARWGQACSQAGTAATCTITVSAAATIEASFSAAQVPKYPVKVVAGSLGTGTGTVTGPGIACTVSSASQSGDCSEELAQGTQLTLAAAGTGGSTFAGWGQACAGTSSTCTITVSQVATVEASFAAPPPPKYVVKVVAGSLGTGAGTVTAAGISCAISGTSTSGDCSEELVQGTQLTLTATGTGGNNFAGWGQACSQAGTVATCTITVSQAATVQASFAASPLPKYVVKVVAGSLGTGTGIVTGPGIACTVSAASQNGDCSEEFVQGAQLTLTATGTGGNNFVGWGQACAGTSSTCTITVSQVATVEASFAPPPPKYVVTVVAGAAGTGTGTVTGPGLACTVSAASQSGDCSEELVQGTRLTLTATAAGGSTFAGWAQACAGTVATCTITVSQAVTVGASFAAPPPTYLVTVRAAAGNAGSGTVTGAGISCAISGTSTTGDCSEDLVQGTQLTVTAAAAGGGSFLGWGGACASAGTVATCTITVSQAATVDASFAAPPPPKYVVTVVAGSLSTGTGTVTGPGIACTVSAASQSGDCSEQVTQGTQLTLTAAGAGGSTFAGWAQACAGTAATCTITVSQAVTVGASFAAPPPPNLAGFWSGTDAGTNIHYHITLGQSGADLSLGSCAPGDCRLISLSTTGEGWLGASYLDIASLSGGVSGTSVSFTMDLGGKTVSFVGVLTSPTEMVGKVSGTSMPAQTLSLGKQ
jgi:hypothetical protein